MRALILTILALLITIPTITADVVWECSEYDLGTIDESDGIVTTEFKLTNLTRKKIAITDIQKSCGCTTVEYQRTPIAKGESSIISVKYNPNGEIGEFHRAIIVSTSANKEKQYLTIKGSVNPTQQSLEKRYPIDIANFRLNNNTILFGDINNNSSSSAFLLGYNHATEPIELSFENIPDYIYLSSNLNTSINRGEKITIIATFDAVKYNQLGRSDDSFTLKIKSADGNISTTEISTIAMIKEDFSQLSEQQRIEAPIISTSTDKLHFQQLERNSNSIDQLTLTITNRGVNELIIHKISSSQSYINSRIIGNFVKGGESAEITIYLTPSYIPTEMNILNEKITIISNDPTNPMKEIHLVGEIK